MGAVNTKSRAELLGAECAHSQTESSLIFSGLTKRQHFAALMLQGMLSADVVGDRATADHAGWAKTAVTFADALLEELAK